MAEKILIFDCFFSNLKSMQKKEKKSDEQRHSSLKFDYAKYKAEEARNRSQV